MRNPALPLALCCAVLAAGCGSSGGGGGGNRPATESDRTAALGCLRGEKKLDARPLGEDMVAIGPGGEGPRIKFFLNGGEAEAAQFEGREEGSEQIGSALFFVDGANDDVVKKVEDCLDDLA